jgi:hypothetical protein
VRLLDTGHRVNSFPYIVVTFVRGVFTGPHIETAVPLLLPVFIAVRMYMDIPLLLRNLATDCLPTRCVDMSRYIHFTRLRASGSGGTSAGGTRRFTFRWRSKLTAGCVFCELRFCTWKNYLQARVRDWSGPSGVYSRLQHLQGVRGSKAEETMGQLSWHLEIRFSSHGKHVSSIAKISFLMLFKDMITVYCENGTKHINTLCDHSADFLNIKAVVL